jgi:hypothetical protein
MTGTGELKTRNREARGAILIACLMAMAGTAFASPAATDPILVLEAYGGRRPANIDRYMKPLRDALEQEGFAARPERLEGLCGRRMPRPGILDKGETSTSILRLVDQGYEAFSRARFEEAASMLAEAIVKIKRNSALLVLDTGNQEGVYKAHVALALSQSKLGRTDEASATMAELARVFRTRRLSRNEHGPTAEQFARKIYEQELAKGRGALRIHTGNPRAMIFVDRQIRGMGEATLDDLIPGVYHVLVQEPQTAGLAYEVEVPERGEVELDASWEIDTSLSVDKRWVGFELANDKQRHKEAIYGAVLARRCTGRDRFAVVGTMKLRGRPALIGTLYRTTGQEIRSAIIVLEDALDDADDATLGALARFLGDGTPADGLDIIAAGGAAAAPARPARRGSSLAPKLVVIAGAAAVVAGVVLYAYDEDIPPLGQPQPKTYFDSAAPGVALAVAGAIAMGAAGWWWARSKRRSSVPVVSIGRSGGVIGLAWQR